jgi:hypothetical protein
MSEAEFAKTHLRDHLLNLLVAPVSEGFWSIHATSKELCDRNGQPDQVIRTFQNMLTKIPEWTETTLATEVDRLVKTTKCTYLDDLLMGVFISYMKSFASIHYSGASPHVTVDFERPSMTKFIHEVYVQCARQMWQVAYLFKTVGVTNEQQARNRNDITRSIRSTIESVIQSFLPWESIAKQFSVNEATVAPVDDSKRVLFDEESDEEEEQEAPKPLQLSEDSATIEVDDLDKEEDVVTSLEANSDQQLVLNL